MRYNDEFCYGDLREEALEREKIAYKNALYLLKEI